jgi:hypothetical protein
MPTSLTTINLQTTLRRAQNMGKQMRFAAHRALNDVGFRARNELAQQAGQLFDRVTPFIQRSFYLVPSKGPDNLTISLYPRDPGGKAIDPADVLNAEVYGGRRKLKRSERAFNRVGILPNGYYMVPSKQLLASDKVDAYGNVKGSFMVQLISYFQAFGEQGYRANMTAKRKRQLAKFGKSPGGYKRVGGVQYFVSFGRLRSRNPNSDAAQHLAAGIWQRSGTHGVDVKPVFLFTRAPAYTRRFPMDDIVHTTVQRELPARYRQRFTEALATAR